MASAPETKRGSRRHTAALLLAAGLAGTLAAPLAAELVVTNADIGRVTVYATGATGDAAPLRTLQGNKTFLDEPSGVAIDPVHNEMWVADFGGRLIAYALDAKGNPTPVRRISGVTGGGYFRPVGVAIDLVHDEVWAASIDLFTLGSPNSAVFAFPRTANGEVTPLRRIAGPASHVFGPVGLAYDAAHSELWVADQFQNEALVFARGANGDTAPLRWIGKAPGQQYLEVNGVVLLPASDEVVISDRSGFLDTYARTAQGHVVPKRRIQGQGYEFNGVAAIGTLELATPFTGNTANGQNDDDRVFTYPRLASGAPTPARTIGGPSTLLAYPGGIAFHTPPLFLAGGRFMVQATWKTNPGAVGDATPFPLTDATGLFWFFDAANLEAVVKVLDGCALNHRFWVFAAGLTDVLTSLQVTDLATGVVRVYENPQGKPFQPIQDTAAFATCATPFAAPPPAADLETAAPAAPASGSAPALAAWSPELRGAVATSVEPLPGPGCSGLCLGGRFQVSATWRTPGGQQGNAVGQGLTGDTGYLWFFDAGNVEAVVKIVDGCALNQRYWFFAGGLTDVKVDITVLDTANGTSKVYHSQIGKPFQPIQDTSAFATCP